MPPGEPRLITLRGPASRSEVPIGRFPIVIGRRRENDIAVADPSVSRRHCQIVEINGRIRLVDLDSQNGVAVNDELVEECFLDDGDEITVGSARFQLTFEKVAPPPQPSVELDERNLTGLETISLRPHETAYLRRIAAEAETAHVERTARDFQALLHICSGVQEERTSEQVKAKLLSRLFDVIPAERGAVLLANDSPGGGFRSIYGRDRINPSRSFTVSRSVVRQVIDEQTAYLRNRIQEAPEGSVSPTLIASEVQSVLAVPLMVGRRTIGALYFDTTREDRRFDRRHLELATAAAATSAAALEAAVRAERLREKFDLLEEQVVDEMVGKSRPFFHMERRIAELASAAVPVLILGEKGAGKRAAARALHRQSDFADGPFAVMACGAGSEDAIETELFGRGAATGKIERAFGGTLLLDEVGALTLEMQKRLIAAITQGRYSRPSNGPLVHPRVRFVCTSSRDLMPLVRQGRLREDLHFHLNSHAVVVPPLRDRRDDIPLLAEHFAYRFSRKSQKPFEGITPDARRMLLAHSWPGNVSELENVTRQAEQSREGERIEVDDLPESVLESAGDDTDAGYHADVNAAKRRILLEAMEQAGGSFQDAAAILKINRTYLHRLIRNLDLKSEVEKHR